jgi:hypothetical protein
VLRCALLRSIDEIEAFICGSPRRALTMRNILVQAALTAGLLAGASAAQAATLTLSNWKFGAGKAVHTSTPAYSGQAGGFVGTLGGADAGIFSGAVDTYCVELTQSFGWGVAYDNYSVVSALSHFGATKALTLGRLMSYVVATPGAVDSAAESTSLQLAIWNIVYDNDLSLAAGGSFADSSAYGSYATTLLASSANQALTQNVYVLKSATQQDQLVWRTLRPGETNNVSTGQVPEPMSLALVAAALGGLALVRRRRVR